MKVEVQSKKGLRTCLSIVVDKKTIEKKLNERLIELQSEVSLKGFRPGKVPPSLIKSQFGKAVYGEVVDKILKEIDKWLEYELPPNLLGRIWKGKYRGQRQKWFIVKFIGYDSEINLKTKHPEFIEWKWIEMDELPGVIVDFKKDVYEKLLIEIKKFIN